MRITGICVAALVAFAAPLAHAEAPLAEPEHSEVISGQSDGNARMTVPVRIGEHGPFQFIIDTGSQTTVISDNVARQLALPPGRKARIIGIAGPELSDTVLIDEIGLGARSYYAVTAPVMQSQNVGADGIVGTDGLQGQRILLDFTRNRMAIGDARSLGGNSDFEIVVTARRRSGQLIMTNAEIDGVTTDIVIDTGAELSIGNRALQRILARRMESQQITLLSITGDEMTADLGLARRLTIDSFTITNLTFAFADSPVFGALGLTRRPALFLGMRDLRLFRRVAIDFNTKRVYFDLPDGVPGNSRF